jgi:hypothetical protein
MIYARAHGRTMGEDYYAAMDRIEQRLMIGSRTERVLVDLPLTGREQEPRLSLAAQSAEPDLKFETRLDLVKEEREVLHLHAPPEEKRPMENENERRPRAPPQPSPAFPWVETV